ncbi:unnamed protein product [Amoebophrya sp. A25]|nr:unnamed protein product [Amoebophrya sp. A25]|eukprot:GSA25T00011982001.1
MLSSRGLHLVPFRRRKYLQVSRLRVYLPFACGSRGLSNATCSSSSKAGLCTNSTTSTDQESATCSRTTSFAIGNKTNYFAACKKYNFSSSSSDSFSSNYTRKNHNQVDFPTRTFSTSINTSSKMPDSGSYEPGRDKYTWLEEVHSDDAMTWVKDQNKKTLEGKEIEKSEEYTRSLAILDSKEKIAYASRIGGFYYNFWRDDKHVRGIWRRCRWAEYAKPNPDDISWETVLDLDALGKAEDKSWVWGGYTLLKEIGVNEDKEEDNGVDVRALVKLSPGGSDAIVVREYSLTKKAFVDGSSFTVPEGKTRISFVHENAVFVGAKFENEPNGGLTDSGYPRMVKQWSRGTKLEDAVTVFEGLQTDVASGGQSYEWTRETGQGEYTTTVYDIVGQSKTFYTRDHYVRNAYFEKTYASTSRPSLETVRESSKLFFDNAHGEQLIRLTGIPDSADIDVYQDWAMISLRKDWGDKFPGGSLLVAPLVDLVQAAGEPLPTQRADSLPPADDSKFDAEKIRGLCQVLFQGGREGESLQGSCETKSFVVVHKTINLKPELLFWRKPGKSETKWSLANPEAETSANGASTGDLVTGKFESVSLRAVDWDMSGDDLWFTSETFSSPEKLYKLSAQELIGMGSAGTAPALKSAPIFFDDVGVTTVQKWATSKDGTRVPYFLVGKDLDLSGKGAPRPTTLYGYGGFEISLTPSYMAIAGFQWIEKGGVFALANIRGGGEFGPKWHQAALKENRPRAYEDFEAVGKDLLSSGIAGKGMLGCMGGSNGGLLTGNMLVRSGEDPIWSAIVSQCPLLDMRRFHTLLAGASWMAEYDDPDREGAWTTIQKYSPYHMIASDTPKYPAVLFTTSTKDDRVHPGHARKMVKKLLDLAESSSDVRYYENIEGGHSGAADNKQRAFMKTLEWMFLWEKLDAEGSFKASKSKSDRGRCCL